MAAGRSWCHKDGSSSIRRQDDIQMIQRVHIWVECWIHATSPDSKVRRFTVLAFYLCCIVLCRTSTNCTIDQSQRQDGYIWQWWHIIATSIVTSLYHPYYSTYSIRLTRTVLSYSVTVLSLGPPVLCCLAVCLCLQVTNYNRSILNRTWYWSIALFAQAQSKTLTHKGPPLIIRPWDDETSFIISYGVHILGYCSGRMGEWIHLCFSPPRLHKLLILLRYLRHLHSYLNLQPVPIAARRNLSVRTSSSIASSVSPSEAIKSVRSNMDLYGSSRTSLETLM